MDSAAGINRKESGDRAIKSFVLRSGRMSPAQKRSYENLFPFYAIKGERKGFIESSYLFGNANPLNIEIGYGMGKATAGIALNNPENNYLGIEVHRPGIGRLLWEIEKLGLKNIRIIEGDAAKILADRIQDNSISAFHIFFPDPWPKKRHHKRRLIKRPFTDLLAAKLLSGGYIYMASDWVDYGDWALKELSATPCLTNKYSAFSVPQEWRPETEFEKKGRLKNHEIRELFFTKT
jgi:tRNA (guanine-N7-)-methyltransferase